VITPFFSVSLTTAQDVTVATTDQTTSNTVITKDDAKTDTTNTITQTKTFLISWRMLQKQQQTYIQMFGLAHIQPDLHQRMNKPQQQIMP